MTAQIYDATHWYRARRERARRGKAPRLAIQRSIYLRQRPNGDWGAAIRTQRFGLMSAPEWLCREGSLGQAMAAVLIAWRQHRLPVLWAYADDRRLRPFYEGVSEPKVVTR